ncbi:MAG TPA: TonB-dependent receptor plug domain-containing protein [Allosphingosinicella sp.]|nr:TonB-dependent receptor plug domain-containing protein [Allosphingosinicella sp.]
MGTVGFAALAAGATPAFAQADPQPADPQAAEQAQAEEAPAAAPPATQDSDDAANIIVTGTRVRSPFLAPTPTLSVGAEEIQDRGASSIVTLLQESPAINTSRSNAASNGVRTQTAGANFVDLRGLGPARTLVLVDGRRFVPMMPSSSAPGQPLQVDINLLPTMMVERMDIVTGGASAQWGSDAIAGVVNLILRHRYEGIQGEMQYGVSQYGDRQEYRLGGLAGFSFAGGRGNVVVSGDYIRSDGLENRSRDWSRDLCYLFNDPASTAANQLPQQRIACDAQSGNRTAGGLIVSATGGTTAQRAGLVGMQFDSATAVSAFVRGDFNPFRQTVTGTTTTQTFQALQSGGQNINQERVNLLLDLERTVLFGHANYELTDNIKVSVDASYGRSRGTNRTRPVRDQNGVYNPLTGAGTAVRIYADNPFIPAALRPFIPAPAGPPSLTPPTTGQSFQMTRDNYDFPQPTTVIVDEAYTYALTFNGDFGGGWEWDASYSHGQNTYNRATHNTRDRAAYARAVDAVINPANGQIVCRSTLVDPANGCVPLNLFGQGTPSAAAIDYVTFTSRTSLAYVQDAAQVNLRGSPFSTWAGEVAIASGLEWRHESANSTVDDRAATGVTDSDVGQAFTGSFSVFEGYAEATVPLATDLPFARRLALNGAVRHAQYSGDAEASGGQTTWKIGGTWEPVDGLLFRITRSLDIRSPSLFELKVPPVVSQQNLIFGGVQYTGLRIANQGNINLVPERSNMLTFGGSFSPRFLPGLNISIDYFDINVEDVITTIGAAEIARNCDAGVTSFCSLLVFNDQGGLAGINDQFINAASNKTSGIDFALNYRTPLFRGELSLRANATYVRDFTLITASNPPAVFQYAGMVGNTAPFATPKWRGLAQLIYRQEPWSVGILARYVGSGRIDTGLSEVGTATAAPQISPEDNKIGSYVVFNLSGTFDILDNDRAQLFWNIENVFNRDPPLVPNTSSNLQTNGALYDVVGRYFRLGFRFEF